ncbi:MAG: peptidylprolyl isomerase [Holophaga sp.]|jgi:peptidyl-prolyl cis-trans isomerase A (cyclophilin A)/peptidyl-prolyl cis-trans isomerase B (cyclophilin B)
MRLRAFFLALAALAASAQPAPPKPVAKPAAAKPEVVFTTTLGSFTVQLDPEAAPKTAANFLSYVKKGHYKGTTFHRVIANFMIQGGGMDPQGREKPTDPPIQNEAKAALGHGLRNVPYSIAMARTPDPDSATSQFFINVRNNAFLDYPGQDGAGYCVFGTVVKGMDTVDKIRDVKTGLGDQPLQPVVITDAKLVSAAKP